MADVLTAGYASEASGHWYTKDGKQVDKVLGADGKTYITRIDIRHARKYGLLPGATTIIKCAAAPGLEAWKIQQGIMAALTLPRRPHEPDAEFIKRVLEDSKQQAKNSADEGTLIHAAIERAFRGEQYDAKYIAHVDGVRKRLLDLFGERKWVCERTISHPLGWGSKIDIESEDGEIQGDFKSKEFVEPPTGRDRFHYDEHACQLGAYRQRAKPSYKVSFNMFISRNVPGLVHHHLWEADDLKRGWEMFVALHRYWSLKNSYRPGWDT